MHGRKGSNESKEGSPRSVHGHGTFDWAGDVNLSCAGKYWGLGTGDEE